MSSLDHESLRSHRFRQAEKPFSLGAIWEDQNMVFANGRGRPVSARNMTRRAFKSLLQKADLPDIRFHDLRHTEATLLLSEGMSPKAVSDQLGHGSVAINMDVYAHVTSEMQAHAAAAMDAVLGPA